MSAAKHSVFRVRMLADALAALGLFHIRAPGPPQQIVDRWVVFPL